ncbi:endonuclease MutS2 [Clostridium pasteurianum DSM 525 = ATCC 6013]|uniref:DNA mismatch repair protein MutS domain protein n=2 Tax=Clostridium pasteurianum TaxID=1501 RepID=A0A0H3J7P0_CLOPA|nr:MutS-like ATPase [Clostridium pasteurianum]AJA49212.1 endonuclease MutS2 [Clostridium pasteurianum DSM 525 = ATCC 6013]AJA53200.1 endonuclease MutS2 [Clostridium pasteurianum DSM 525 = ATCC 6013]AOZ76394.1 hypothetical protein AQ983_15270 [Clostridium pasteurianum DSM 525 = ATCC 6013]AOZ80191.1 hypothetical protein AQ984_15265 [Clostridium pasteurianum]ELP59145.1 MutS-like ATPase [Clostridium pasteurianum DSM 525 = ATCC 6013]
MNYMKKDILDKIGFYYVLDKLSILTPYGRNLISHLQIIREKEKLLLEYNNIERCFSLINDAKLNSNISNTLMRFKDIRNTFIRCREGQVLDEVELYEIKCFVSLCFEFKDLYKKSEMDITEIFFHEFSEVYKLLNPLEYRSTDFYVYDEYSSKLKIIRLKKKEFNKTLFKEKDRIKQKQLLEQRQQLISEEREEEFKIRKALSLTISQYADKMIQQTISIGNFDLIFAKAKIAVAYKMARPVISNRIKMDMGVNPMVKNKVEERGGIFSPVSIEALKGTTVITGANMGGKTVLLSIIALNYMLASTGFFVFAKGFEFTLLDFIYFLSEDSESIKNGLSSFGGEIFNIKYILSRIKSERGLIILDEFAKGTNPTEGANITKALLQYLNKFDSICIMSTHYDGVCSFANFHYQVKGLRYVDFNELKNIAVKEEDYLKLINDHMDYTLEKVDRYTSIPRDAINICSLMGIDEEIINIAKVLYEKEEEI